MKTTVERLDPVKVKLTVEVEPPRVRKALDEAAKHLSEHVQIKGFRKGKVPRRLLEQRVGAGAVRQHAVEDHLGQFYVEALRAEDLDPVGQPEIDLQSFDEQEGAKFEATVEVRPEFEVPPYEGIDVTHPEWEIEDDEVDAQLDQLRERFAELEEVDRPARQGDYATLDLEVRIGGELVEDATVEDALYEIGSGGVTPKLDEELVGVEGGSDLTYTDTLPDDYPEHGGEEAEFTVTIKDVRAKQLPELDDDFALTASEFETIEELRADIRRSLLRRSINHARQDLRARILEAYLANVEVDLPPSMIERERDARVGQVEQQAEQYGMEVDQLLELQDTSREDFDQQVEQQATQAVKAQLVLDRLAHELDLQVEASDVDEEIYRQALMRGTEPQRIAKVIQEQGSLPLLVSDILRRKAIDALVEAAHVEGGPPREALVEAGLEDAPGEQGDEAGEPAPSIDIASTMADVKQAIEDAEGA